MAAMRSTAAHSLRRVHGTANRWAERRRLTPLRLAAIGFVFCVLAAVWFSSGRRDDALVGAAFLLLTLSVGALGGVPGAWRAHHPPTTHADTGARGAEPTTEAERVAAWTARRLDTAREGVVYFGVAAGGVAAGVPHVWGWAIAALACHGIAQTVLGARVGTGGPDATTVRALPAGPVPLPPVAAVDPSRGTVTRDSDHGLVADLLGTTVPAPRHLDPPASVARVTIPPAALRGWSRRVPVPTQRDRFLVVALTVVVADVRVTFAALLLAAAVTVAAALTRLVAAHRRELRDDGPFATGLGRLAAGALPPLLPAVTGALVTVVLAVVGYGQLVGITLFAPAAALLLAGVATEHPHDGRFDGIVPPLLRGAEYVYLAVLGYGMGVPAPLVFVLLAAVVIHHCDTAQRRPELVRQPAWARGVTLGWDGRMLLVALAGSLGWVTLGYALIGGYLWSGRVAAVVATWLAAPVPRAEPDHRS